MVNGTVEWMFAFPDRAVGHDQRGRPPDDRRRARNWPAPIWRRGGAARGLPDELPPWQIVRERRATFAATPAENAKRPPAKTAWSNLVLAGDWTATGLPATIEGAIRSGNRAAECVML